jgi:effector-binding domain-containing protein
MRPFHTVAAIAAAILITVVSLRPASAADDVEKAAAAKSGPTIGEMRVQTIPALTYLYVPIETSFENIGEPVVDGYNKVFSAASESKLLIARPTMITYEGGPHVNWSLTKTFKAQVGIVVEDGTQAAGEAKVRKTQPFKCATILYTGTVNDQGKAYEKLVPALKAAGLVPTGEEREMCLYWEGVESANNVFFMQVGVR